VGRYLARQESDPAGIAAFGQGDVVTVTTDRVNLRDIPGLAGTSIAVLATGATGRILDGPRTSDGFSWYHVESNAGTGWGVGKFFDLASNSPVAGYRARVVEGELNLRVEPDAGSDIRAVLPDGAMVDVLAGVESADGYQWLNVMSSAYGSGWVVDKYLQRL
jgi:hypothetical protein